MPSRFCYPRPEYPRPDFQRGASEGEDWVNLNGPWQFRFDPERRGSDDKWFQPGGPEWREQIIVPFCWESLAAWGEGDSAGNENFYSTRVFRNPLEVTKANHRTAARYEVGWYRRRIQIPSSAAWKGKHTILKIGAADFFTDAWCNGVHLGHHEGGYNPFEFELTEALTRDGDNLSGLIVLRVEDPMDNSEQPVGKQWHWYTTTSGIWQTVYLEPRGSGYIKSFRMIPDIDANQVQFAIACAGVSGESQVDCEVTSPDAQVQRVSFPVKSNMAEGSLKLESRKLWNPNEPNLYHVSFELRTGKEVQDVVRSYFGMRKIDVEVAKESGVPTAIRVNDEPRYLRGALYQSYYPDGVYTASSVDVLRNDIESAKRFGFNFLRVHIKVDDPMLLYLADEIGILLMADFPNFGEGGDTPPGRQRFETMMRETIERDFNHPAIFAWCLFNETWGFGGQSSFVDFLTKPPGKNVTTAAMAGSGKVAKRPAAGARPGMMPPQRWVQKMWELAKSLDQTRLVEDMSVCHWEHLEYYLHCDTDINSWHFYINDYAKAKSHIERVVKSTFIGSSFNYVPGFLHKGQPLINSEYGGIGALDGDRDMSWSFKFLTNELRRHPQIAAYIYTELNDVEWEYNGFLNYDRTPKEFGYDPRMVNESNALPVDAPPVQRVGPGEKVKLEIASAHYSTKQWSNVSLHWAMAAVDDRGRFHQELARGCARIPFPHRQVAPAHTLELEMPAGRMLCTVFLKAYAGDGTKLAENLVHYLVSNHYPAEREEADRALILRALPANWTACAWSGPSSEREKARANDYCFGSGHGYFEWLLPLGGADLNKAFRIKLLCEASSHRSDAPQTDNDLFPTTMQMFLNDVRLYNAVIRNHPHDSRGVLSYLRGGVGAYGYLTHAFAEGEIIRQIAAAGSVDGLRLRCAVPADALAQGGLTIYGAECGSFPVSPTVVIEW